MSNLVKESGLARKHLPLIIELDKVMQFRSSVASKSLSSFVVSKKTDSLSKDGLVSIQLETNKFVENFNSDIFSWVLRIQVNIVLLLVRSWLRHHDWEPSHICEFCLVLVVEPVECIFISWIWRSFNLEDVISNLYTNALDVGPHSRNLGSDVNVYPKAFSEFCVLQHYKIALSLDCVALVGPSGGYVWFPIKSIVFLFFSVDGCSCSKEGGD
mmetsp:Transcript_46246/g.112084  ORF Transcript_46246/g.112084 Transcript_46246/m.112084 type:complete len:213 (-) Transcript_46246:908-1546(-)